VAEHRSILKNKGLTDILVFFQNKPSAILFKRSWRELSIDVAEQRSILKNKGLLGILVIFQNKPIAGSGLEWR